MGISYSSSSGTRYDTLQRSRAAFNLVCSADRQPLQAQLNSKSAEIVTDAWAPCRNGAISTPSKHRRAGGRPGAKLRFRRKIDSRTVSLILFPILLFNLLGLPFAPTPNRHGQKQPLLGAHVKISRSLQLSAPSLPPLCLPVPLACASPVGRLYLEQGMQSMEGKAGSADRPCWR
jgi:hypothetical protein